MIDKNTINSLGYPYSYGDNGPDKDLVEHFKNNKAARVGLLITIGAFASPTAAVASTASKTAVETARASACAVSGACLTIAVQQAKCGNIPATIAAICASAMTLCIERTLQLASNSY